MSTIALGLAAEAAGAEGAPPTVYVEGQRPEDTRHKLLHILPEVDGTRITVTNKHSTTKLDRQPVEAFGQGHRLPFVLPFDETPHPDPPATSSQDIATLDAF